MEPWTVTMLLRVVSLFSVLTMRSVLLLALRQKLMEMTLELALTDTTALTLRKTVTISVLQTISPVEQKTELFLMTAQ